MKIIKYFLIIWIISAFNSYANNDEEFDKWKSKFKERALKNNISEITIDMVMTDVKFLQSNRI